MLIDPSKPCTQATLAGLIGVAQPVVAGLVAADVLRPGASLGEWLAAYCRDLRDRAHGRGGSVAEARRRVLEAQARQLELKNRAAAGRLVDAAEVERSTFATWRTVRDVAMVLPDRLGPVLAAEHDAARCTTMLADEIRAMLRRAADALEVAGAAWIEPLARAQAREIEAWGRAARPDVPEDVAELAERVAGLCARFASHQPMENNDAPPL